MDTEYSLRYWGNTCDSPWPNVQEHATGFGERCHEAREDHRSLSKRFGSAQRMHVAWRGEGFGIFTSGKECVPQGRTGLRPSFTGRDGRCGAYQIRESSE